MTSFCGNSFDILKNSCCFLFRKNESGLVLSIFKILKHYKYHKWLYMCYISSFKNSNNSFVFLKPESSRPQSLWSSETRKKNSLCDFPYTFELVFIRSVLFQLGLVGGGGVLISTVNSFEALILIECQTGTYNFGYRNWSIFRKKTTHASVVISPPFCK